MEEKTELKLYLIERIDGRERLYDEYESAVVAAPSEEAAKIIHPGGGIWDTKNCKWVLFPDSRGMLPEEWVDSPSLAKATLVGIALPGTKPLAIIHTYYHWG